MPSKQLAKADTHASNVAAGQGRFKVSNVHCNTHLRAVASRASSWLRNTSLLQLRIDCVVGSQLSLSFAHSSTFATAKDTATKTRNARTNNNSRRDAKKQQILGANDIFEDATHVVQFRREAFGHGIWPLVPKSPKDPPNDMSLNFNAKGAEDVVQQLIAQRRQHLTESGPVSFAAGLAVTSGFLLLLRPLQHLCNIKA